MTERSTSVNQHGSLGLRALLGEALRALGPRRRGLIVLSALAFVQSTLETTLLYLVARLAMALATDTHVQVSLGPLGTHEPSEWSILAITAGLLVLLIVLSVPTSRYGARLSVGALVRARTRIARAWFESSYTHRAGQPEGHLNSVLSEYTQRVERLVQHVATAVVSITSLAVLGAGTIAVAPLAALVSLVGLAALGALMRPFSASVRRSSRAWAGNIRAFNATISQSSRMSQEIVAFGVSGEVATRVEEQVVLASHDLERVRAKTALAPTLYQYGALAVVLSVVGLLLSFGAGDDLESVAPVLLLMVRALTYAKQLQTALQSGNELSPYLAAMETELAELAAHPASHGDVVPTQGAALAVDGVSYTYGGPEVLRSVSLRVGEGEVVGIVGPSGGGKSTLVQLLLRLREPSSGSITLAGVDLSRVDDHALATLTAFVPQDNRLLRGTVAENIRFFRDGFDDAAVEQAGRAAHLHDEIMDLPDGYATDIGPGARDISGGQRQRLGIARALLGRPALLVLDEPTSALDQRSEHLIRDTLLEMRGHTTVIVVAHRMATIEICDRVLRVADGVVTEVSDHRATVGLGVDLQPATFADD